MSNTPPKNIPASVREKLRNVARARNADFGLILVKYGLERILYRLSRSPYRSVFILKGALLFELWTDHRYRPTRDADFLASGDNSPDRFAQIFRELCAMETEPDGLRFDSDSVIAERISEGAEYEGVRVIFLRRTSNAQAFQFRSMSVLEMPSLRRPSRRTIRHYSNRLRPGCSPTPKKPSSRKSWKPWWNWGLPIRA